MWCEGDTCQLYRLKAPRTAFVLHSYSIHKSGIELGLSRTLHLSTPSIEHNAMTHGGTQLAVGGRAAAPKIEIKKNKFCTH